MANGGPIYLNRDETYLLLAVVDGHISECAAVDDKVVALRDKLKRHIANMKRS